jgi:hypothetical protein
VIRAVEDAFAQKIKLWAQYRGASTGATEVDDEPYPCACCQRWWKVVWVTAETAGEEAAVGEIRQRAQAARAIQCSAIGPNAEAWDEMKKGTRMRVPTKEATLGGNFSADAVVKGEIVDTAPMTEHPAPCPPAEISCATRR